MQRYLALMRDSKHSPSLQPIPSRKRSHSFHWIKCHWKSLTFYCKHHLATSIRRCCYTQTKRALSILDDNSHWMQQGIVKKGIYCRKIFLLYAPKDTKLVSALIADFIPCCKDLDEPSSGNELLTLFTNSSRRPSELLIFSKDMIFFSSTI